VVWREIKEKKGTFRYNKKSRHRRNKSLFRLRTHIQKRIRL